MITASRFSRPTDLPIFRIRADTNKIHAALFMRTDSISASRSNARCCAPISGARQRSLRPSLISPRQWLCADGSRNWMPMRSWPMPGLEFRGTCRHGPDRADRLRQDRHSSAPCHRPRYRPRAMVSTQFARQYSQNGRIIFIQSGYNIKSTLLGQRRSCLISNQEVNRESKNYRSCLFIGSFSFTGRRQ